MIQFPGIVQDWLKQEHQKLKFVQEASERMRKQFDEDQTTLAELHSRAEELSKTAEGCRDLDLRTKVNEEALSVMKEKVAALTDKVGKLKESVKAANLACRNAQIRLQKAESTMGGKRLSLTLAHLHLAFS